MTLLPMWFSQAPTARDKFLAAFLKDGTFYSTVGTHRDAPDFKGLDWKDLEQ